jgi:Spy/CpxP family protein refolding chaperone
MNQALMEKSNTFSPNSFFKLFFLLLLISLFNLSFASYSASLSEVLAKLNLSEVQKVQIEYIQDNKNSKIVSLQSEIEVIQNKLNIALSSDLYSDQEIDNLKNQIDLYQSQISDLKTKSWKQIKAILTPEQEAQLRQYKFTQ